MKKTIFLLQMLLVLMLAVPQQAKANDRQDVLKSDLNYSVIPKGNGVFTIKVPVYVGSAWGNYWARGEKTIKNNEGKEVVDRTSGNYVYVTIEGKKYELLYYYADNFDNDENTTNDVYVQFDRDNYTLGLCAFTNSNLSVTELRTPGSAPVAIRRTMEKDVTGRDYNTTYLEFDWKGDYTTCNGKSIEFSVSANYIQKVGEDLLGVEKKLPSYKYSSYLTPPTIGGVYLNPEATSGNEGQVKIVGFATKTPTKLALYVNGSTTPEIKKENLDDMTIDMALPASDRTRVIEIEATFNENGLEVPLKSKPYTILPYHKIQDVDVMELHANTPEISSGHKKVTWSIDIDTLDRKDMFESDYFIVERAYLRDLSDAVKVGQVAYADSVGAIGKYEFVDESKGAVHNPETGGVTYYRVSRATAANLYSTTTNLFSVDDSVENKVIYQPKVYIVEWKKDPEFDFNRKVNVAVKFDVGEFVKDEYQEGAENINYYEAKWNDDAIVMFYVDKKLENGRELGCDSMELNTKELQYDSATSKYSLSREYTLQEPGVVYNFRARVVKPSDNPYFKFAHRWESHRDFDEGMHSMDIKYDDLTSVRKIKATEGTEHGFVRVTWELPGNRFDKLTVLRRKKGQKIYTVLKDSIDSSSRFFADTTADLGEVYEYGVMCSVNYYGITYSATAWSGTKTDEPSYGWVSPTAKIAGKVVTMQGTGIGGQLVKITGADGFEKDTLTNVDGTFDIDGVYLTNNGAIYTIQIPDQNLKFTYNGEEKGAQIGVSAKNPVCDDIKFVCTSVERFSGRVLFENSTVPVSGAMFRINGETVHGANNQPIKTDSNGNFEFYVPKHSVTVQVYKKGHRFVNDGYILCKDVTNQGDTLFNPSSAYDGLTLYDQTKVLLRGRVIGGNTLAAMPLGQGLTKNNLGDSITLQIKLEGNNTANIVYLADQPDKDTLVVYKDQEWDGKVVARTRADFFRKQINIHVDNKTGEYAIELFPTKYKITQAFAQGYASLFAKGEVAQVLDLTDSVAADPKEMKVATHSITYHSDVDITYEQLAWGVSPLPHLGVDKQVKRNLFNEEMTTTFAYVTEDDSVKYLLGAPVFLSGEHYFLRGFAHEDYYYNNNEETGDHFVEPIRNDTVHVQNELAGNNPKTEEYPLDQDGQFLVRFVADNNNFSLSGEDALRSLHSSVVVNGFYYQSKPIKAYVTGSREKAGEVFTAKNADIRLFDILRDPYSPTGYSYYGKGKQYEMSRNFKISISVGIDLDITSGGHFDNIVGSTAGDVLVATSTSGGTGWSTDINIPIASIGGSRSATYNFTSKDVIKTSDDPEDVGAMADVYIGATSDFICKTNETITIIDEKTYIARKKNIEAGLIKVIQEGVDIDGKKRYLVTAEELSPGITVPSTFVYSQQHILTKVVPQLLSERNSLLVGGDTTKIKQADVQMMAEREHKTLYYYKKDRSDAAVGKYGVDYVACFPDEDSKKRNVDEIDMYNKQIAKWLNFIRLNEELKVNAINDPNAVVANYSLSGGQNVSYSEEIGYKDSGYGLIGSIAGYNFKNNVGANTANMVEKGLASYMKSHKDKWKKDFNKNEADSTFIKKMVNEIKSVFTDNGDKTKAGSNTSQLNTPTTQLTVKFMPDIDLDWTDDAPSTKLQTFESGYEMKLNDDSYMNVSVYKTNADSIPEIRELIGAHDFVTENINASEYLHQYVFVVNGGATRNPWCDADTTLFYAPGMALGVRTQKIDNPVMKISTPEVSNIPEDEKAVFTVKLINDSELTGNQTTRHDSDFILKLVDESNEKGAKISIDGMPLTDGRTFTIAPGESMNKTIEVLRGDGYDFDDIQLEFACKDDPHNSSVATFSVHYLPSSSPVKISAPTDKWVMNTFSAKDSIGYYMPIVVEGYNVGYKNFDHIEIQYKKSTEGDANWVNLCSYYIDDDLYEAASGTKSMEQIGTGKITHAFYGEKDPIEMKYDIRAVTFCRLGTGFVTKASNVISGMKDTRRPTIFGQSQPLNGILTSENSIMLPFSEPIAYNYLDETSNFDIRGYVNSDAIDTNVGLMFPGEEEQDASTTVYRNLGNREFTIDMLVQPAVDEKEMTFFSHGDADDGDIFTFGINAKRQLFVNCNGTVVNSVRLAEPVNQAITHVGAEYSIKKNEDGIESGFVRFFVGNSFIKNETDGYCPIYTGNSPIHFGVCNDTSDSATAPFKGRMLEVRLWNQTLDADMVSAYDRKRLDGYHNRIIGYWPMRQANGKAEDVVTGANLELKNVNWHTETGHSLIINNKSFALDGASFQRSANFDYTLSFWMNIKEATEDAKIFSAGSESISEEGKGKLRIGFDNGEFVVCSNGNIIKVWDDETNTITDGMWHHFALSVSHSKNIANIYVDGYLCNQVQGDMVDGISMEDVCLGGEGLKANIDLLAFWHQALPQNYLEEIMDSRLSGDEMGLYVYLPFDENVDDTQGSISNRFTVANKAKENKDIFNKIMVKGVEADDVDIHNYAPVLDYFPLTKLKYSWSSDGTNLLINLDMKDSEINHRNIFLTVRDVEDLNGNTMANPYSWVISTDLNTLRWDTDTKKIKIKQNETLEDDVTWKNISSVSTNYLIASSSPYIKIKSTMGTAAPNHTNYLSFTIDKGITPGEYEEYIWLYDEDNDMVSTLTLDISVEAEKPAWTVDRSKFDQTMTIIATVHKNVGNFTILDNDTRDMVGVFAGSECVGVANISDNKDLAQVYLNVYGNSNNTGKTLSFYLWDYSEGIITQLTPDTDVKFKADSIVGMPPAKPLNLTSSKSMMQEIALNEGWNWIALNVKPFDASSPKAIFLNSRTFSNGDIIKDDSKHAEYSASTNKWLGDAIPFSNKKVYHVFANKATRISIVGKELSDDDYTITVKKGWNQLPYLMDFSQPIAYAMADFQKEDKASEGDIIKGIDKFAVLSYAYGWIGSLESLEPGAGYYLYHTGQDTSFKFNADRTSDNENIYDSNAKTRSTNSADRNMIIIAALADGEELPEDAVVKAYSGDECIGDASPIALPDGTKRYFVTIPETGQSVHFVIDDDNSESKIVGALPFNEATCIGTLESPYIFSGKNLNSDSEDLYDLSGRKVKDAQSSSHGNIYVKKGAKVLK